VTDPDDPYLPERIRRALTEPDAVGELDVQVVVRAGRVVLSGNVADARRRDEITGIVQEIVPDLVVCNEIDLMVHVERPVTEEHLG
jgi:hypothetical protein